MEQNAYVILMFIYQVGVFISRSSLFCFRINKVGILTFFQFVNFVLYATIAKWKWLQIEFQFILMFWIGLMGGCSYVNCFYLLIQNKKLPISQKEVAVNLVTSLVEVNILMSSILSVVVDSFVLTQ